MIFSSDNTACLWAQGFPELFYWFSPNVSSLVFLPGRLYCLGTGINYLYMYVSSNLKTFNDETGYDLLMSIKTCTLVGQQRLVCQ